MRVSCGASGSPPKAEKTKLSTRTQYGGGGRGVPDENCREILMISLGFGVEGLRVKGLRVYVVRV